MKTESENDKPYAKRAIHIICIVLDTIFMNESYVRNNCLSSENMF